MLSYSRIIQQSYRLTMRNPVLWLFGLFVVGGFNLNFLHFQHIPARQVSQSLNPIDVVAFFADHPELLALLSFSLLLFSLLSVVITNWCRIMLVLAVDQILKTKFLDVREQMGKSKYSLAPVIQVSLGTTFLTVVVAAALILPPFFVTNNPELQTILWAAAAVLFVPIAFAISCINIFTTYFVILFKQRLWPALNLGTDFFVSRWTQILGLTLLLMIIYVVCFFVGVAFIYVVRAIFDLVFGQIGRFSILSLSAMIVLPSVIENIAVWLLLSMLSVFINTALLLLFLELITPIESEEAVLQKVPAVSSAGINQ